MKKIDKAVEIIRGWSDEELKEYISFLKCPKGINLSDSIKCGCVDGFTCEDCWNEEVEE